MIIDVICVAVDYFPEIKLKKPIIKNIVDAHDNHIPDEIKI